MKKYNEFIIEGVGYQGGNSDSSDADRIAAYSDLTPAQRKELDDYCESKYDNRFQDCSFEEQSTARSIIWTVENDPDEIEKQNKIDAEL
tara:strand:+ start:4676 stop:4942 length:267 start_codon:yes stop_codon:yes gene_type:complete